MALSISRISGGDILLFLKIFIVTVSLYLIVGDVGSAHARRYQAVTQNTMIVSSSSRQEGKEGGERVPC